ncbi:hypothetical protein HNQ91_005025 [Filimonas zeae]|uniref:Uncharacterized protein n=1 Tax=Filimonas zeae TaxID=1737353 RepID=A0A917J382_9BACT|nr:hypothetical protein [Filimonas zeae]MDR6341948.1 hypothetical protein [Filimonas zeae]GGH79712.1 hypothetical protein GCM10011379_49490 [Filimonas zeae]
MNKKRQLGHINNLADLQKEIQQVNTRIKLHEKDLKARWDRLPQETIKATLGSVIPFFLRNQVAGKTWTILKSAISLFAGAKDKKVNPTDWKGFLLANAKHLGLIAALRGLTGLVKKKKSD